MKSIHFDEYAAFVGIDWANSKHDICLQSAGSDQREPSQIQHTPQAISAWVKTLQQRFGHQPIAVCCELRKGPLLYALTKYPQLVLFPLNPASVAKYREAFTPSHAKDDPSDAELQCDLLQRHFNRFRPLMPDSPKMQALQQLVEYRRTCVGERVCISNRLSSALKNYYPQVLDWFQDKGTVVFCDFVSKWSSLEQVKRVRKPTLENFFSNHNVRHSNVIAQRIKAIRAAIPLTKNTGVIHANQLIAQAQVQQLRLMLDIIKHLDIEIAALCKNHTDHAIFASFPGAGPVFSARLLAAFGDRRERYRHASEMQTYGGVAPVLERSGKKSWVHWRYAAPTFLRQTFVEWAGESVRYSFWANAYYQQQKQKGKPHQTIIRSLAFKWIRIMFRCWQQQCCYDETKYLNALKAKRSPLLQFAVSQT